MASVVEIPMVLKLQKIGNYLLQFLWKEYSDVHVCGDGKCSLWVTKQEVFPLRNMWNKHNDTSGFGTISFGQSRWTMAETVFRFYGNKCK